MEKREKPLIKRPKSSPNKFKTDEAGDNYMYKRLTFTKKKKTIKLDSNFIFDFFYY